MCLDHVNWTYKNRFRHENKVQGGYKVFRIRISLWNRKEEKRELVFAYELHNRVAVVSMSKWLKSEINTIEGPYELGFHLFRSEYDAALYRDKIHMNKPVVIKIKYKGIKAEGTQYGVKTIVADRILIPKAEYLKAAANIVITGKTAASK